jgi:hypothetical protein
VEDGGHVGHLRHGVRLAFQQGGELAIQEAVLLFFFHNKKVKWQNYNVLPLILQ